MHLYIIRWIVISTVDRLRLVSYVRGHGLTIRRHHMYEWHKINLMHFVRSILFTFSVEPSSCNSWSHAYTHFLQQRRRDNNNPHIVANILLWCCHWNSIVVSVIRTLIHIQSCGPSFIEQKIQMHLWLCVCVCSRATESILMWYTHAYASICRYWCVRDICQCYRRWKIYFILQFLCQ